jgi:hypothetical protein
MALMVGFDSFAPVTDAIIAQVMALTGRAPAFCGRYMSGIDYHGAGEYTHATESPVLARHGIPLLPIGRYTTRVGGTQAQGLQDGGDQAEDLKESLGTAFRPGLLLFLDVEADTPLSSAYWTGWAQAVSAAGLLPAIYGSIFAGGSTWISLRDAIENHAPCAGIWGAYYKNQAPTPVPEWADADTVPVLPDGTRFTDVPVLLWQYCGDYAEVDINLVNPQHVDTLLSGLAVPGTVAQATVHDARLFTHDGHAGLVLDAQLYPLRSLLINGVAVPIDSTTDTGVMS